MKLFHTTTIAVTLLAVLLTVAGASAVQIRYSSVGSTMFASDGFGTFRVSNPGGISMGSTWTPEGVFGGWSGNGVSGGFGYSYDRGMTGIAINQPGMRGAWTRGMDGRSYGGFGVGSTFGASPFGGSVYTNSWASGAPYYSQYGAGWGGGWGSGYNQFRW